jgi:chromosome segregation protein
LELIKEISKKTQFLAITHNKQTMASADRLIGITMQEKGISTALSVNLERTDEFLNEVA